MKSQNQTASSGNIQIFLYNPTQKMVYVRDLDIKVKPGETVDVLKYSKQITRERALHSAERGSMRELLVSGTLIMSNHDSKVVPQYIPYTESRKPVGRRQLLAPLSKQQNSNFIERLQQDFGERAVTATEAEVAKNTESLINSVDFEGFDDPLE